jgi:NADH-quinone oxidoreductase subunit E
MLAPPLRERAEALVRRYPVARSALLPLLHLVQSQDGMITKDGIAECAELLGLTKAEVNAVATFYTMYKRAPLGRHLVSVCTNFSCKVRGAQDVYERLSETLGVGHNGTTEDGAVTLEHAECLGNCEGAPVVTVDYLNYECLDPDAAVALVERVIAGEVPPPTRGFPSPGIRDIEYRLAGLGPRTAREGELSVVSTSDSERPPRADTPEGPLHDGADKQLRDAAPSQEGARRETADAGLTPEEAERESGYSDREMPTDGAQPGYPSADPRKENQEPDQEPGDRDTSRLITSRDQAEDGIADRPQSEELGAKTPPEGERTDG